MGSGTGPKGVFHKPVELHQVQMLQSVPLTTTVVYTLAGVPEVYKAADGCDVRTPLRGVQERPDRCVCHDTPLSVDFSEYKRLSEPAT